MFDAMSFVRKNAKSLSTPVVAFGFKMKLEGWTDDTAEALVELARNQTDDVKVSLPKIVLDADRKVNGKSAVLAPKYTAQLIAGQEEAEEGKSKKESKRERRERKRKGQDPLNRGGIDSALNGQHQEGQPA